MTLENDALRARIAELEKLVYQDALTGLHNRRWLDENLPGHEGFLVMFDLDSFKPVNDKYGYETGDNILREFAGFLVSNTRQAPGRQADTAAFPARRGGDEFLVLVDSLEAAERLRDRLSTWCSVWYGVTVSCGVGRDEAAAHEALHSQKVFKSLGR